MARDRKSARMKTQIKSLLSQASPSARWPQRSTFLGRPFVSTAAKQPTSRTLLAPAAPSTGTAPSTGQRSQERYQRYDGEATARRVRSGSLVHSFPAPPASEGIFVTGHRDPARAQARGAHANQLLRWDCHRRQSDRREAQDAPLLRGAAVQLVRVRGVRGESEACVVHRVPRADVGGGADPRRRAAQPHRPPARALGQSPIREARPVAEGGRRRKGVVAGRKRVEGDLPRATPEAQWRLPVAVAVSVKVVAA